MRCPKCGAENAEGITICKRCWSHVSPQPAPVEPESPPSSAKPPKPRKPVDDRPRGPLFGVPYVEHKDEREPPWVAPDSAPLAPVTPPYSYKIPTDPQVAAMAGPSSRAYLAFVLGLLSIFMFCMVYLSVPLDLAAIVLGGLEIRDIRDGQAPLAGRGLATAAVVLAGFALLVKVLIFFLSV